MWRRSLLLHVWAPVALFVLGVLSGLFLILYVSPPMPISEQTAVRPVRQWDSDIYSFVKPVRSYEVARLDARPSPRERALAEFIAQRNYNSNGAAVGVYVEDLTDARAYGFHADDTFTPASLLKVPLAMAAVMYAENTSIGGKRFSISKAEPDENIGEYFRFNSRTIEPGILYDFDELIEAMLMASDNNARRLISNEIGGDAAIQRVFSDLQIQQPPSSHSGYDFLTPRQDTGFLRALVSGTYLSDEQSQYILKMLNLAEFSFGIRAGVPDSVAVASKFGERTVYGVGNILHKSELHECGVVYTPTRPFMLCIMTKGDNLSKQADVIREVSRFVYRQML